MLQRPSQFDDQPLPAFVARGPVPSLIFLFTVLASSAFAAQSTLAWVDNSSNESGFKIERATQTGSFVQIATTGSNVESYVDTTAASNTVYLYRVRAYNAAGHSSYTNIVTSNVTTGSTPSVPGNTAPTISAIANRSITEDGTTGAIAVTVGDKHTSAGGLQLSGTSSNATLVPPANITFGGSGAGRTVTVKPATDQNGTATITVQVSDGALTASRTFTVAVTAVNDAPTISSIANQSIQRGTNTGSIGFSISDPETAASSLTLSATSSNTTLVPAAGIKLGGSGANRTVTVTPVATRTGTATITVRVSDGKLTSTQAFSLSVSVSATVSSASPVLTATDIGAPRLAGSYSSTNGTIQIRAAGADIWGTSDQFRFAHQQLRGDTEMTVRVASLQNINAWAKAGLMFRASLAANAAYVSVYVTPSKGVVLHWRTRTGAAAQTSPVLAGAPPEWLRLLRTGDTFYAFRSENGTKWDLVEFEQVDLPDLAYGGLAVTSHDAQKLATATFTSFTVD